MAKNKFYIPVIRDTEYFTELDDMMITGAFIDMDDAEKALTYIRTTQCGCAQVFGMVSEVEITDDEFLEKLKDGQLYTHIDMERQDVYLTESEDDPDNPFGNGVMDCIGIYQSFEDFEKEAHEEYQIPLFDFLPGTNSPFKFYESDQTMHIVFYHYSNNETDSYISATMIYEDKEEAEKTRDSLSQSLEEDPEVVDYLVGIVSKPIDSSILNNHYNDLMICHDRDYSRTAYLTTDVLIGDYREYTLDDYYLEKYLENYPHQDRASFVFKPIPSKE